MYNGTTVSLMTILWKVLNNPHAEGLNYEDAAEYAIEALRLIGAPLTYSEKVSPPINLTNYKAALPSNIITIRGVKLLNGGSGDIALTRTTDLYHAGLPCKKSTCSSCNPLPTSNFDTSNVGVNKDITATNCCSSDSSKGYTYTAQNGVIQTSVRDGEIVVSYTALSVDEKGYPLVPDNVQVRLCLEYYILFRFLEPLWTMGKITDKVFHYIDQKKCFYMGASNTSMQLQGIDHLESVMNAVNRLLINDQAHKNFYEGSGTRERLKRY